MFYTFNVVFTLLMIAMLIVAASPRATRRLAAISWIDRLGEVCAKTIRRYYWILFALVLTAGVFVRVWRFGVLPMGLNQDGAMAAVDGYALALYGTDRFGTSYPAHLWAWGYGQMSALYSYLCIPFFKLLGLSRFSMRLPMLCVSLLMLPVVWDLARRLRGRYFALLALFLVCINPWQMMQSRWALDCNLMGHCLLLGVYLLVIGTKPHRGWALFLAMVPLALCMYSYGVAIYSTPVLLLLAAGYLLYRKRATWPQVLLCAALWLLISAPIIVTMMINYFQWDTMQFGPITMQLFDENARAGEIAFMADDMYRAFANNGPEWLRVTFLQGYDSSTFNSVPGYRTMYIFSFPVLIMGLVWFVQERRRTALAGLERSTGGLERDAAFLVEAWLIAMAVCGLLTSSPNVNRANGVYYALILLCAYGVYRITTRVRALSLVLACMYAFGFAGQCVTYFSPAYTQYTSENYHTGLYEAIESIKTFPYEFDTVYITSPGESDHENTIVRLIAAVALGLDLEEMNDEKELPGRDGEPSGYYTNWFYYQDFADFEPNPEECAAYVVSQKEKLLFDETDYLLWDYEQYAVAYPRYWVED